MARGSTSCMGFVGVTTGGSSIRKVFPEWADTLHLPTRTLVGHDLPLDSPPEVYRELVGRIRDDPEHWGALVTTHKMAVHAAAADLFDELDELATTFGEVSCIAKRGDRLLGSAKDPVTAASIGQTPKRYTATRKGKKLVLEVTDTGPGLHIGQTRPKLSTGVGLANIRDRLAQAYGAQQSFETRSIPGGGFSVTLELPFTRNANQEA